MTNPTLPKTMVGSDGLTYVITAEGESFRVTRDGLDQGFFLLDAAGKSTVVGRHTRTGTLSETAFAQLAERFSKEMQLP